MKKFGLLIFLFLAGILSRAQTVLLASSSGAAADSVLFRIDSVYRSAGQGPDKVLANKTDETLFKQKLNSLLKGFPKYLSDNGFGFVQGARTQNKFYISASGAVQYVKTAFMTVPYVSPDDMEVFRSFFEQYLQGRKIKFASKRNYAYETPVIYPVYQQGVKEKAGNKPPDVYKGTNE